MIAEEDFAKLESIVLTATQGAGLKIKLTQSDWAYSPSEQTILVSQKDLTSHGVEACAGIIYHEVSHERITRYLMMMQDIDFPTRDGLTNMLNAIEDTRIENWSMNHRFPGSRVMIERSWEIHDINLSKFSRFEQYMLASVLEWQNGWNDLEQEIHSDVTVALSQTKDARIAFHNLIPNADLEHLDPTHFGTIRDYYRKNVVGILDSNTQRSPKLREMNIRNIQHKSLDIAKEKILPVAKNLLESDMNSLASQLKEDQQLKDEIKQKTPPLSDLADRIRAAMLKQPEQSIDLSDDMVKRALEVLLNNPPPNTSGIKSPLIREGVGTERISSSENRSTNTSLEMLEDLLKHKESTDFESELTYYKVKETIDSQINQLVSALELHLSPRRKNRVTDGHRSGNKINLNRAMMFESDPNLYDTIWQRRMKVLTKRSVCFSILLDLSGSMYWDEPRGHKISNALKALVLISESLSQLEIPFTINGFNIERKEIKNFQETIHQRMIHSIGELEGITEENSQNYDGKFLRIMADEIFHRPEYDKFIIVISDGVPKGEYGDGEEELQEAIEHVQSLHNAPILIGLGIGEGTDHVNKYYSNSHANIPVDEITSKISEIIQNLIIQ
jgi:hypothetical protein